MKLTTAGKIIGGLAIVWYAVLRGASALAVGIKGWALNGVDLDSKKIGITLQFAIANPLFIGLTIRGIQGDVYVQGQKVGSVDNTYDYFLAGRHTHIIPVLVQLDSTALGQAAIANIKTGNVRTLTIAFNGKLLVGSASVPVPIQITYDWGDLVG